MQIDIVLTEKKDTDLTLATNQTKVTGINKSIVVPQKVVPAYLSTTEEQLEKQHIYLD